MLFKHDASPGLDPPPPPPPPRPCMHSSSGANSAPRDLVLVTFDVAPEAAGDVEIQLTESTAVKSASDPFGNGLSMRWIDGYVKISSSNMTR
ncbi:MAG: hypothetical protein IPG58_02835 [Acidobacteria bacterium]|nr:hypothetical protein [Acidobacteriota bacterium]